ncbi:MAG: hypothetical protein ACYDBH_17285 [Acidobacteriaceae bacterium]
MFALDWFGRLEIVRNLLRQIPAAVRIYLSPATVVLIGIAAIFIEVVFHYAKVGLSGRFKTRSEQPIPGKDPTIHLHLHDICAAAVHIEVTTLDHSNETDR